MRVREKFPHADIGGDRFSAGVIDYYDKDILEHKISSESNEYGIINQ